MGNITPTTELSPGTQVTVGNMHGIVIGCRHAKDQFGAPINVHRIYFYKRYTHRVGNERKYKEIGKTEEINYAGIYVIEN